MTPFEAATHGDPYSYYALLRQQKALFFDADLGLWIASGAEAVEAVLESPDCRVRPLHEPIPPAIAQGAAGDVFGRLMRMNEGARHRCPRMVIEPALASIEMKGVADMVARVVTTLGDSLKTTDELMFTLPACVIASLIGLPSSRMQEVAKLTRNFVACLSPLSDEAQINEAHSGATQLSRIFSVLLRDDSSESLFLARIRSESKAIEWADEEALIANLIGLMSQTCEATAGLIGNTLVALHRNPDLIGHGQPARSLVGDLVAEVARYDSPVQNTRRFVAKRCTVGDTILEAGDTVLVLFASANRDPGLNPDPDSFLLKRSHRRAFSFGSGRHECPGQQLALTIASEAILEWLQRQPSSAVRLDRWSYLPSLNGRIPKFYLAEEAR